MKNIIYYFTGTGNSLTVAREIAKRLNDCDLIPVTRAIKEPLTDSADIVGICFPVYAYKPPHIVKKFLKLIKRKKHMNYVFVVATFGGATGNIIPYIKRILNFKNFRAGFIVKMPYNFLAFGSVPEEYVQKQLFNNAQEKIDEIINTIKLRKTYFEPVKNFFKTYIHPGIMFSLAYLMIPSMDKDYYADDNCKNCGSCANICPANNIVMQDGKPQWQHHCEQCWACVHWCPRKAIQYKKSTLNKIRYHHPQISLQDLKLQKII